MSKLQEKKQEFLEELNNRLPRGCVAHYEQSKYPHSLNVIISRGYSLLGLFVLEEGVEVNWWKNDTGVMY